MTNWQTDELQAAVDHGLIDQAQGQASTNFGPTLWDNQATPNWVVLRHQLLTCTSFDFSVAFITDGMVSNLKPLMRELAAKGVHGRLLTSTYLGFNAPKVFAELRKLPNLTVRLAAGDGFHQKGYYFAHDQLATLLIGSANLTERAMFGDNQEWLLQVDFQQQAGLARDFQAQFAAQWQAAQPLTAEWLADYAANYQPPVARPAKAAQSATAPVQPNAMQAAALAAVARTRQAGHRRALVIAATGTGKTYLAALAVQQATTRRVLFVAHREQILRQTMATFQRVLGGPASDYGLYTGQTKHPQARYLFASVQSLQKHRAEFAASEFDYLIVDEVHHAPAQTYRAVLDYFTPAFYLGLTATPERADAADVYALFDYQVAYESRLPDALAAGLLTDFHYVGVADYQFTASAANQRVAKYYERFATGNHPQADAQAVALLSSAERVRYLLEQTAYYGYSGDRLCGLIFCASVAETTALAQELTAQGHPAAALTGDDPPTKRERLVAALTAGELDYLVTVDIFNEGIDIPAVNQVVFLRNTASPVVFQQQLGRGLRKAPGKDYVVVIDFIGNFKHNYLLPLALTGDTSGSLDAARETVAGQRLVGHSTIAFEPVAQERVLATLTQPALTAFKRLRASYLDLKQRLGRIPLLADFTRTKAANPLLLVATGTVRNYAQFLARVGEEVVIDDYGQRVLNFLSAEVLNGKRRHELLLLQGLLAHGTVTVADYQAQLTKVGCLAGADELRSVERVLNLTYFAERARPTRSDYGGQPVVELAGGQWRWGDAVAARLANNDYFRRLVQDVVVTGLQLAQAYLPGQPFTPGQKYRRKDAVRLINNPKNLNAQIVSGYYFTNAESGLREGIFFVTYRKRKGVRAEIDYRNEFLGRHALRFFLNGRDVKPTAKNVVRLTSGQDRLHLFVQRSTAVDQQDYYYLGTCHYQPGSLQEVTVGHSPRLAVDLAFDIPLDQRLLDLIVGGEEE